MNNRLISFAEALIFSTFASRFGGRVLVEGRQSDKEGRIYFKINIAQEEKIVTFAARSEEREAG